MLFLITTKEEREICPSNSSRKNLDDNFDGSGLGSIVDWFLRLGVRFPEWPCRQHSSPHSSLVYIYPHTLFFPYVNSNYCLHKVVKPHEITTILTAPSSRYFKVSSTTASINIDLGALEEMSFSQVRYDMPDFESWGQWASLAISNLSKIQQYSKKRVPKIKNSCLKKRKENKQQKWDSSREYSIFHSTGPVNICFWLTVLVMVRSLAFCLHEILPWSRLFMATVDRETTHGKLYSPRSPVAVIMVTGTQGLP